MQVRAKRWVGRGVLALGVVAIGGVVALGAVVANPERVVLSQVHVEVRSDGNARVTEVIDYDFGPNSRHGIFRDVPGLLDAPVQASSDAPDDVEVTGNRIRVGNPNRTVRGRHRYRLTYELGSVAPAGVLRLNAVGTGWEVPINPHRHRRHRRLQLVRTAL